MEFKNFFLMMRFEKQKTSMQGRFALFSFVLFLLVFVFGNVSFFVLMGRIFYRYAGYELMKDVETASLRLEASMSKKISVLLKAADSPYIRQYFAHPDNPELQKKALEEIESYKRALLPNSLFLVNNIDIIFSSETNGNLSENYWCTMSLNIKKVPFFNVSYNPNLGVEKLWISVPVFDNAGKLLGIVGTGKSLSDFTDIICQNHPRYAAMYIFNSGLEIIGARDISLASSRVLIDEKFGEKGMEILSLLRGLDPGGFKYFQMADLGGVIVLGSIPSLGWYITALRIFTFWEPLRTNMTVLFVIMIIVIFVILLVFNKFVAKLLYEAESAKKQIEEAGEEILSSIKYASNIQKNLLPGEKILGEFFSDYSAIWKPRDIVGGDIYWAKKFDDGMILCVCDCTGHGMSGALLTMLVVSAFEAVITEKKHKDTAGIVWELEKRLVSVFYVESPGGGEPGLTLRDGCDLAVLFISKDGGVAFSSSHIPVIVCDGENVTQYRGQNIFVGEGRLKGRSDINTVHIPAKPGDKFYIASDGLFDQPGGIRSTPFGYEAFKKIILKNHDKNMSEITEAIWTAFENYRGKEPRVDDLELIAFKVN